MLSPVTRTSTHKREIAVALLLFSLLVGLALVITPQSTVYANNVTNNTVLSRANISNTEPNITSVTIEDDILIPANEIDLIANDAQVVTCNATVFDYNGNNDIISANNTNATLFIQSVGAHVPDDNNHKYTNSSCGRCVEGPTALTAFCDCKFAVQYYANSSTDWMCQFSVTDSGGYQLPALELNLTDTQNSSTVTVREVLGIDVPTLLNYGNLSVTETSDEVLLNVSNVGNVPMNFSVRGFGGTENESVGGNLSMICEFGGNISIGAQRYEYGTEFLGATNYGDMFNLTNQSVMINQTILQRLDDDAPGRDMNTTIWRLLVPLGVGGICNGTIIYNAFAAENFG